MQQYRYYERQLINLNKKYLQRVKRRPVLCNLSHDVASESDITPRNDIDKQLVVYRLTGNVLTSIIALRKISENLNVFTSKMQF